MYRVLTQFDEARLLQWSSAVRRWGGASACVIAAVFLLYRGNTSDAAMGSVTVPLMCAITSLLLLMVGLGVAAGQPGTPAPAKSPADPLRRIDR